MKRRRGYFKHFNDSYLGETLGNLMHEKNYFLPNLYWVVLERCNQKDSGELVERYSYFERILNVSRAKLRRSLTELQMKFDRISIELRSDSVWISVLNYAEYQESRGQKTSKSDVKKGTKTVPIKDNRLKIKDKRSMEPKGSSLDAGEPASETPKKKASRGVLKVETVTELMHELGEEKYREWLDLYPDQEWVNHELKKAWLWYKDHNKHKKTARGWKTALTSWLGRGWDRHVNNKPTGYVDRKRQETQAMVDWALEGGEN